MRVALGNPPSLLLRAYSSMTQTNVTPARPVSGFYAARIPGVSRIGGGGRGETEERYYIQRS